MGLDDDNVKSDKEEEKSSRVVEESDNEGGGGGGGGGGDSRYMSESSVAATEEEDDDEDRKIELGPQCTLKEQLEKDKVFLLFLSSCFIILFQISQNKIKKFNFVFVVILG